MYNTIIEIGTTGMVALTNPENVTRLDSDQAIAIESALLVTPNYPHFNIMSKVIVRDVDVIDYQYNPEMDVTVTLKVDSRPVLLDKSNAMVLFNPKVSLDSVVISPNVRIPDGLRFLVTTTKRVLS